MVIYVYYYSKTATWQFCEFLSYTRLVIAHKREFLGGFLQKSEQKSEKLRDVLAIYQSGVSFYRRLRRIKYQDHSVYFQTKNGHLYEHIAPLNKSFDHNINMYYVFINIPFLMLEMADGRDWRSNDA